MTDRQLDVHLGVRVRVDNFLSILEGLSMADRRHDRSEALTWMRAVRALVQRAIEPIQNEEGTEVRLIAAGMDEYNEYQSPRIERFKDVDADEMARVLQEFIQRTERWR